MIENIVVSTIGSESEDRKTFSSTHSWNKNGSNLIVYINNSIRERDIDYSILDENTLEFTSSLKNNDEVKMIITKFADPSGHKSLDDRMYELDRLNKKSENKVQTSINKRVDEESLISQNAIVASQIWLDDINSDPEQAKEVIRKFVDQVKSHEGLEVVEEQVLTKQGGRFTIILANKS
jgi:hypothetical protein